MNLGQLTHSYPIHCCRQIDFAENVMKHYSRSLLHVPTPTAAARCHAACMYGVCGKQSSAIKSAPPNRDDTACRLCAILSSGFVNALLANAT